MLRYLVSEFCISLLKLWDLWLIRIQHFFCFTKVRVSVKGERLPRKGFLKYVFSCQYNFFYKLLLCVNLIVRISSWQDPRYFYPLTKRVKTKRICWLTALSLKFSSYLIMLNFLFMYKDLVHMLLDIKFILSWS